MGRYDYYKPGDWNAICEVCGQKYKASKLKKRWDGILVCDKDWEPRHPQDFVRGVKDVQSTPFTRAEVADSFVTGSGCSPCGQQGIVGIGIVGCMIVGLDNLSAQDRAVCTEV